MDLPIVPMPGNFYRTRSGLNVYISDQVDFYGVPHWKGQLLDPTPITVLWYFNGQYSPAIGVRHELDITERLG